MKYRKKSHDVEARRWNGERDGRILDWVWSRGGSARFGTERLFLDETDGGVLTVEKGYWIVLEHNGHFMVYSDDIFRLTYEAVSV